MVYFHSYILMLRTQKIWRISRETQTQVFFLVIYDF